MPSIAEGMVATILATLQETVNLRGPLREQIREWIATVFRLYARDRKLLALLYAGLASSEYLKEWESIYQPYYDWVDRLLEDARKSGELQRPLHTARTARIVIGAIESAAEQVYLFDEAEETEVREQMEEVFEFVVHALGIKVL